MRIAILENTQLGQWQALPEANDKGIVRRSDNVRNVLLQAAAGKGNQQEEVLAPTPAVMEEITSVGSADWIWPEIIKPSDDVRVAGDKAKVLSQGAP